MKRYAIDVKKYDDMEEICALARKLGLKSSSGTFEPIDCSEEEFDIITLEELRILAGDVTPREQIYTGTSFGPPIEKLQSLLVSAKEALQGEESTIPDPDLKHESFDKLLASFGQTWEKEGEKE